MAVCQPTRCFDVNDYVLCCTLIKRVRYEALACLYALHILYVTGSVRVRNFAQIAFSSDALCVPWNGMLMAISTKN